MNEKKASKILKAISDETRIKIILLLLKGERCVCEIYPLIRKNQSTISIHLNRMEDIGLLSSKRDGKKIFYKIKDNKIYKIFTALGLKNKAKTFKKCL